MNRRVLFIDLHDGHVFLDKTDSPFYRHGSHVVIDGRAKLSGLYSFDGTIKSIELTELLMPALKFGSYYPLKFELDEGCNDSYIYNFDHFDYKEPTTGCDNGMYILYFKRTQPKLVTCDEGNKWVNEVINKSISIMENSQIFGMDIKSMYHSSLECVKKDLRKMGVDIWYDAIKQEPVKITAEVLSKNPLPDFVKETKTMDKTMDYIDNFWKYHSIKIYNDRLELLDDLSKNNVNIVRIQDPKSKEIIEKNRDLFILFLKDISDEALFGIHLQLIFIPKEHKTILKSDLKQSVIIDHDGKGKFDYLLAKELIFCKYRNKGKYDWYDKLTQHRKIKEV